jgi:hypothetical protein
MIPHTFYQRFDNGRRGRGTRGQNGGDTCGDLCTGVLPQAKGEPGSTSGQAGKQAFIGNILANGEEREVKEEGAES